MKRKLPKDLYDEAIDILLQSELLKKTVIWQDEQVDKLQKEYPDDQFQDLPWDVKEEVMKKSEELMARLNQSVKELMILDRKMAVLRKKVQERFGKDVVPPNDKGPDWKKLFGEAGIDLD